MFSHGSEIRSIQECGSFGIDSTHPELHEKLNESVLRMIALSSIFCVRESGGGAGNWMTLAESPRMV
jgi:hypothetical protein